MARRVGICAVEQTIYEPDKWWARFQTMGVEIVEALLNRTGLKYSKHTDGKSIGMAISVSDDVFDARTISNTCMGDMLGSHMGCEEKVAQEGIQSLYYALAAIQSGHVDAIIILGHCKESQAQSRNMVTHVAFDPFYTRPPGMDFCNAAGLQAQAYLARSGITEEQLAEVVVRARENAAKNPYTPTVKKVTKEDVMKSPMLCDPIRELHAYPVSDGALGMIVAAEEIVREVTDKPVWISGVGNCMDHFFLGDRDLTSNFALQKAAERSYKRAGITDPRSALDVVEISDQYAYQFPMWLEGLGLCDEGKAGELISNGGKESFAVNPSGGLLAGNPMILGGLVRAAEVTLQLRGEAGEHQVDGAKKGLAHGVEGPAGQFHSVVVLESD